MEWFRWQTWKLGPRKIVKAPCGFVEDILGGLSDVTKPITNSSRGSFFPDEAGSHRRRAYELRSLSSVFRRSDDTFDTISSSRRWRICLQSSVVARGNEGGKFSGVRPIQTNPDLADHRVGYEGTHGSKQKGGSRALYATCWGISAGRRGKDILSRLPTKHDSNALVIYKLSPLSFWANRQRGQSTMSWVERGQISLIQNQLSTSCPLTCQWRETTRFSAFGCSKSWLGSSKKKMEQFLPELQFIISSYYHELWSNFN